MSNIVLIESLQGRVIEHPLAQLQFFSANPSATYTVINKSTGLPPEGMALKRQDDDLQVVIEQEVVVSLEGFYAEEANATFSIDGSLTPAAGMAISSSDVAATGAENDSVWQASAAGGDAQEGISPWVWAGGALLAVGAVVAIGGGDGDGHDDVVAEENTDFVVTLAAAAGPFTGILRVELFDTDGNLLATADHDFSTGPVSFTITNGYTGPILARATDINGADGDFVDETTGVLTTLGEPLRAMGNADGTDVSLSITPLTELAVRVAGITGDSVSAANLAVNDQIATLFGLADILAPVTTVAEDGFNDADGLNDAEKYGQALAILSGVSSNTDAGSVDEALVELAGVLIPQGDGVLALDATTLNLLTDGVTAFEAGINADETNLDDSVVPQLVNDTTLPIIATLLVSTDNIIDGSDTLTVVDFNGTTVGVEDGQLITVSITGEEVSLTAEVNDNAFIGTLDFSGVDDNANISVTADVSDVAGNAATQFTRSVEKAVINTSIVVFDLIGGNSSDHSSQTFDANVNYTIFIRVDSDASLLTLNEGEQWSGSANLGAGDEIILVGNSETGINGPGGNNSTIQTVTEPITPNTFIPSTRAIRFITGNTESRVQIALLLNGGLLFRTTTQVSDSIDVNSFTQVTDLWTGSFPTQLNSFNNQLTVAASVLSSQGLAA